MGVDRGVPGPPYFFGSIIFEMEHYSQWHKSEVQNEGEMMHPTAHTMTDSGF